MPKYLVYSNYDHELYDTDTYEDAVENAREIWRERIEGDRDEISIYKKVCRIEEVVIDTYEKAEKEGREWEYSEFDILVEPKVVELE